MLTREMLETQGNFLFRWRGQMPLVFIPWLAFAVSRGEPIEAAYGETIGETFATLAALCLIGGIALRILAVAFAPRGTSGRNTRQGQVAESLNTTGVYALCRNPLYLGNCMMYVGLAALSQDFLLTLVMALTLVLYYERILMAEERFLETRFGAEYTDWAARVPAFFPRLTGWVRPAYAFSLRSVMRREYPGWLAAVLLATLIHLGQDQVEGEPLTEDMALWIFALLAVIGCITLDQLKKRTTVLNVAGR